MCHQCTEPTVDQCRSSTWLNLVNLFLTLQITQSAQDSTYTVCFGAVKSPVFMDSNYTKSTLRDLASEVSAFWFLIVWGVLI